MSADALLALINDLLDIAKIETSSVELEQIPFSVVRLVQEVVDMMKEQAQAKGLSLSVDQICDCIGSRQHIHHYPADRFRGIATQA